MKHLRAVSVTFLCFFFIGLASIPQVAAEEGTEREKAAEYFSRGEVLFSNGEYEKAARAFAHAYKLAPHPSVLANMAVSYELAGDLPQAVITYRDYLRQTKAAGREDRDTEKRLATLFARVGEFVLECPDAPCQVRVDGVERGDTPVTVVVMPGRHRLEALSEGRVFSSEEAAVGAGETANVALLGTPEPAVEPEPAPVESTDDGIHLGSPFWVATGITGVAGVMTIVFGARTLSDKEEFEDSGSTDEKLKKQGEQDRLVTNIMLGVTAAAGVTAFVFAVIDLTRDEKEETDEFTLRPGLGPGPGIGLTGQF